MIDYATAFTEFVLSGSIEDIRREHGLHDPEWIETTTFDDQAMGKRRFVCIANGGCCAVIKEFDAQYIPALQA